nr:hypothetical protein [Tanacetum cinerariifolium]
MNNEPPQTLPSFDSTCYSNKEISVPCVSKPNFVDESFNIFNSPPQPPIYSCEFCGSNAQYGHYCTPQAPFINPKLGYSQDFNSSQDIYDFQQHPGWNRPAVYDDDDDEVDYTIAIRPVLSTKEPDNSLKIRSGSTTTHSDISLPESDFTHEEFDDELAHIISPPKYDCFYFRNLPDP